VASGTACVLCGGESGDRPQPFYNGEACLPCSKRITSRRAWAFLIDGALAGGVASGASLAVAIRFRLYDAALLLLFLVLYTGLFVVRDAARGVSPGKLLLGLQVVDQETGLPIGARQSLRRNAMLALPYAPVFAAFTLWKGPHLGDHDAGTRVVPRRPWGPGAAAQHLSGPRVSSRDTTADRPRRGR